MPAPEASPPAVLPRGRALALAAVCAAGIALSLVAWHASREAERSQAQAQFGRRVDEAAAAVDARLNEYEQLLRSAAGLLQAMGKVDRRAWRDFYNGLRVDEAHSGIQGLGYSVRLAPPELAAHVASVRAEGFPGYSVHPEGRREEYTAIVYLEPFVGRNLRAFGYDMASEPVRREAMARARDGGEAALSGKVTLVQEEGRDVQSGALLYLPVYRRGAPLTGPAQRARALEGFVYAPLRMGDFLAAALGAKAGELAFELHDGEAADAASRLAATGALEGHAPAFAQERAIRVAGRDWTLRVASQPAFEVAHAGERSGLVLAAGLALTLLAAALAAQLLAGRSRAERLAERMSQAHREGESRIRAVLERTADAILTVDAQGRIVSANPATQALFGHRPEALAGLPLGVLFPDRVRVAYLELFAKVLEDDSPEPAGLRREMIGLVADGAEIPVRIAASAMRLGGGTQLVAVVSDISEQRNAQRSALEANLLNQAILESAPFAVVSTDNDGLVRTANPAAESLLGHFAGELPGKVRMTSLHDLAEIATFADERERAGHGRPADAFAALVAPAAAGEVEEREWTWIRKDGSRVPVNVAVTPIEDAVGAAGGFLFIAYDVTERKRADEVVRHLAHHDQLTGLPNRVLLADRVDMAIGRARRERGVMGVVMVDLDRFKHINDSLGHATGDCVLQEVAGRLSGCLRPTDTVARTGGDEFVIVLTDLRGADDAERVGAKLLAALAPPVRADGHELRVTTSVGIALYPEHGEDFATLLRNADAAMYQAKARGRDTACVFVPGGAGDARERLAMESDLARALERGEFFLEYQPYVELLTGRVKGVEALVRWNHPERGRVSPADFVPLAEETGLVVPIGEWVLRTACRDVAASGAGGGRLRVAVNLSPRQFRHADVTGLVHAVLDESGLPPDRLELEITEGVVVEDVEAAVRTLGALRRLGVRIAIDDFGTGYSSLAYLSRLPIDKLKVDRSFVRDLESDAGDAAVASAIIALGQSLGLEVVAEGVETAGQLRLIRARACHQAQGFFFARPAPIGELARLVETLERRPSDLHPLPPSPAPPALVHQPVPQGIVREFGIRA